ncbi:MAG: PQQ-binding-like beta-propeller repeat protein [Planctomycetota bacterium]|nr:PQQ-binding-like beta-propeller repeat protein [Planctomycetota bacterium]
MADESKSIGARKTGELTPKVLLKLLSDIRENRRVATLLVARGANEKCFYFTIGAIRMVTVGPNEGLPLSNVLLSKRLITREELAKAEQKRRSMEVPLKDANDENNKRMVMPLLEDVLGMDEMLPRNELHESIAQVVRWELEEIFFWTDAQYTIWYSSPPLDIYKPEMEAHKMSFGVYKMLGDVEAEVGAWDQKTTRLVVGSNLAHLSSRGPDPSQMSPGAQVMLRAAQAPSPTVLDLLRSTRHIGAMPFQAIESLSQLLDMGALDIAVPKANFVKPENELRTEAGAIEDWLQNLLDGLAANKELANIYEKLNEPEKSIEFRREIAERLIDEGAYDNALGELQHIIGISERDFPAYERIIELFEQLKRKPELTDVSRKYAEVLSFNKLFNRARRMWQYFLNIVPEDIAARRQLAEAHLQVNDQIAAQQELMNIVQIAERRGDKAEIQEALKDVLRIAPENEQAIDRYKNVVGFQSAVFARRLIIGVASVLILVAMVLGFQINIDSRKFLKARESALNLSDKQEFKEAHEMLSSFTESQSGVMSQFVTTEAKKTMQVIRQTSKNHYSTLNEAYTGKAEWLKDNQQIPSAVTTLEDLNAELEKSSPDLCPERDSWIGSIETQIRLYADRMQSAKTQLKIAKRNMIEGQSRDAFEKYKELVRSNAWLTALKEAQVPIRIVTVPSGARVFSQSLSVGTSPLTLEVPIGEDIEVAAEFPGYERAKANPKSRWNWPLKIVLQKKKLWTLNTAGPITANIVRQGRSLFVGDRAGQLMSVKLPKNNEAAEVLWSVNLGLEGDVESLSALGNALVATLGSGRICFFDGKTGTLVLNEPAKLHRPAMLPTGSKGTLVIYVDENGKLVARQFKNQKVLWSQDFGTLSSPPMLVGSQVIVGTNDGKIRFVDGRTGNLIGKPYQLTRKPEAIPNPVIFKVKKDTRYAFVLENGAVLVVSFSSSGKMTKRPQNLRVPVAHRAVSMGNLLYIAGADAKGTVICTDITTRKILFETQVDTAITGPPMLSKKGLYIQTQDGLRALSPDSGRPLWQFTNDYPLVAPGMAIEGQVIISDSKSKLLSLAE